MTLAQRFSRAAQDLCDALVTHGRLTALALLAEPRIPEQALRAREMSMRMEAAARIEEWLARSFQVPPRMVAWPPDLRSDASGIVDGSGGPVARDRLEVGRSAVLHAAAGLAASLRAMIRSEMMLDPAGPLFEAIAADLPAPAGAAPWIAKAPPKAKMARALRGPRQVALDPMFEPSFSLLDAAAARAMESHRAPRFWCLSVREVLAAELCALSIAEHDGLPLTFYRDFAKQAWDELRHARLFLDAALELLPELPPDHPLWPGDRLPVPREVNVFEAIWNCSLDERLVLMHLDTEGPGVAGLPRELSNGLHLALVERLVIAAHDEVSHARLGQAWLRYLLPHRDERKARIREALARRGMLMVAGMGNPREPLKELIGRYARA